MFVLRDLHFVSLETILSPRLAFAFLFGMHYFKKTTHPPPYVSLFIKALLRGLCLTTSIPCSSCADVTLRQLNRIDDTTVLFLFYTSLLWRLCRIEDSAVLMSLPYSYGDDSAVLRILPYCSASSVFCSSLFYERQGLLISIERSCLSLDRCPF